MGVETGREYVGFGYGNRWAMTIRVYREKATSDCTVAIVPVVPAQSKAAVAGCVVYVGSPKTYSCQEKIHF